jgi:predicted nucleotidyltransferase
MSDLASILGALRASFPELAAKFSVGQLGVLGSFARGEQQEGSDLDVLVDFEDLFLNDLLATVEPELRRVAASFPSRPG